MLTCSLKPLSCASEVSLNCGLAAKLSECMYDASLIVVPLA